MEGRFQYIAQTMRQWAQVIQLDEHDSEDDEWSEQMENDSDNELSEWKVESGTEHKPQGSGRR